MKRLFPDQNPPALPDRAEIPEACIWLLAVMDETDKRRKFAASVLTFYLERGYLTNPQMEALRGICGKVMRAHAERALECQGADASEEVVIELGSVVPFRAVGESDGVPE